MYDLTGRVNNAIFYSHLMMQRSVKRNNSPIHPLYITTLRPVTSDELPDQLVPDDTVSVGTGSENSFLSITSNNSVVSSGFESLRVSINKLTHKTDQELTEIREDIGRESAALYSMIDRLHMHLDESTALIIDRKTVSSRASDELKLLAAIPLTSILELGFIQEFSFRLITTENPTVSVRLLLQCSGSAGRNCSILDTTLACDSSSYIIRGHSVHSFTGIEIVITSQPFVSSKRIPFDGFISIELFAQSLVDGAMTVIETILFPSRIVHWKS